MSTIEQKPLANQDPVPGRAGRAAAGLGIAALVASLAIIGWSANYAMHIPDDLSCVSGNASGNAGFSSEAGRAAPIIALLSR